jgi:sugar O-acyltransferase (sialic acid O-acetyltransferase NeuD family)
MAGNMTSLVILGGGGHGAVVADAAAQTLSWSEIVFADDKYPELDAVLHYPVVAKIASVRALADSDHEFIIAIGDNALRQAAFEQLVELGARFATVVHPDAIVSDHATLDVGTVVMAGAIVNCRTRVGVNSVLNTGCRIDHDCVLAAGSFIAPGAVLAGGVSVGECALVGAGATVIPNIDIGAGAVVGAGATVIKDVEARTTVIGVPAKPVAS